MLVGNVEDAVSEDILDPVVNTSPIKKKGSSYSYIQAGIVVKKRAHLDKDKLLESIAAVMSSLPENERESPNIIETKNQ